MPLGGGSEKYGKWENVRLNALCRDKLSLVQIDYLKTANMAEYRDRRLLLVSPSTVNRELNPMSAIFTRARESGTG